MRQIDEAIHQLNISGVSVLRKSEDLRRTVGKGLRHGS